jgi:hypothetical protein
MTLLTSARRGICGGGRADSVLVGTGSVGSPVRERCFLRWDAWSPLLRLEQSYLTVKATFGELGFIWQYSRSRLLSLSGQTKVREIPAALR